MATEAARQLDQPKSLRELGLQVGEEREVLRSQIKGAPYNPRVLDQAAKRKLKAGLKKHGLIGATIIVNERDGGLQIVGSHQRVAQLDDLAGGEEYTLRVTVIQVPITREKEINILLNNAHAMGDWDIESLGALLQGNYILDKYSGRLYIKSQEVRP